MKDFLLIKGIILLIISNLCDTSNYVCDKTLVPCGCGQTTVGINARIVNGENAIPKSWPMIVSLRTNRTPTRHGCGGTILSESYILTAAHCFGDFPDDLLAENLLIVAGVYNLSQSDGIIRRVDKIIIHPLWAEFRSNLQYDIAILHLATPLNLDTNSSLTRTCLPPRLTTLEEMIEYPSNGTNLVAIGWGSMETVGSTPDILQQVTINAIHHFDKICANTISDPSVQFCAGLYDGGKGICFGDSGGPILQWIGDRWEQVGIASYLRISCAAKGDPPVFTRISYFYDWIQSHIRNDNQTTTSENKTVDDRALYQCYPDALPCSCGRRNVILSSSTSVRSENALPYSWFMIVSIPAGTNNQHICSGTILEDSYIITAAHCPTNRSPKDITIEAGMYYRMESDVIIRQVDRIYIHPNDTVHSILTMNDIAILHVSLPFDVENDEHISRTCLFSGISRFINGNRFPFNGTRLAISGWDMTKMSRFPKSEILQQAEVYVIDSKISNCSMSNDQHQLQFCAGRYGNDQEICYGVNWLSLALPLTDIPLIFAETCVSSDSQALVNDNPGANSQLAIIGWDKYESGSRISDALQQISARSLHSKHELCSSSIIDDTYQFCAELSNSNKSKRINYLCNDGSGGPVLIYKNNHWEQVGIIPYSYSCNSDSQAVAYTRLSSYIEWMNNVTNSSLTTYSSPSQNSGISNQRRNNLIFEILSLLIVIFL